jgi:hypothetical protein
LAARRFLPARRASRLGARLVVVIVLIPYIDDVNIYLTGVAFAGRRIFTPSTFGSAIQTRGRLSQHRASNIAIAIRFRDPGHPQPPNRVRARPVLHLEEPAATLPLLDAVKRTDVKRRTCLRKRCSGLASPLASLPWGMVAAQYFWPLLRYEGEADISRSLAIGRNV